MGGRGCVASPPPRPVFLSPAPHPAPVHLVLLQCHPLCPRGQLLTLTLLATGNQ